MLITRSLSKLPFRALQRPVVRSCFSGDGGGGGMVSYSGGHAGGVQGGFYGSGGARATGDHTSTSNPGAVARNVDIKSLAAIMNEVSAMVVKFELELESLGTSVNSKTIELKTKIRKTISNPAVRELLSRLEIKGEPVWGLSSKERELVKNARFKYSQS